MENPWKKGCDRLVVFSPEVSSALLQSERQLRQLSNPIDCDSFGVLVQLIQSGITYSNSSLCLQILDFAVLASLAAVRMHITPLAAAVMKTSLRNIACMFQVLRSALHNAIGNAEVADVKLCVKTGAAYNVSILCVKFTSHVLQSLRETFTIFILLLIFNVRGPHFGLPASRILTIPELRLSGRPRIVRTNPSRTPI
jgi:hypothetical protein